MNRFKYVQNFLCGYEPTAEVWERAKKPPLGGFLDLTLPPRENRAAKTNASEQVDTGGNIG
jgi:hypothetical protein